MEHPARTMGRTGGQRRPTVKWLAPLMGLALSGCGSINFTPATVTLYAGGNTQVTVTASNSAPLTATVSPGQTTVAVGAQPPGASDTLTIPAQGQATESVAGVTAGQTTVLATAPGTGVTYEWSGSFSVTVNPTLSSISPVNGPGGSTVTLTGMGFTPGATVIFTPSGGSALSPVTPNPGGTSTTLTTVLPTTPGNYGVQVQTSEASANNGPPYTQISQALPYSVATPQQPDRRTPGAFTEFDANINLSPSQTCSTGTVKLTTTDINASSYLATFTNASNGATIGSPIRFTSSNSNIANTGAGFSACTVGIVWNALVSGAEEYEFLNLVTGSMLHASPYSFPGKGGTPARPLIFLPQLWQSPDSTIIMAATPVSNAEALNITFIDTHTGTTIGAAVLTMTGLSVPGFAVSVTGDGQHVSVTPTGATCATTLASSNCTIVIP